MTYNVFSGTLNFTQSTTKNTVWTIKTFPGGGTTTFGGGMAISGGGTPNTGGGTVFRLNLGLLF